MLPRRAQARRHCSIDNAQPNSSQHIPFISSTHFILPPVPTPVIVRVERGRSDTERARRQRSVHSSYGRSRHPSFVKPLPFFRSKGTSSNFSSVYKTHLRCRSFEYSQTLSIHSPIFFFLYWHKNISFLLFSISKIFPQTTLRIIIKIIRIV